MLPDGIIQFAIADTTDILQVRTSIALNDGAWHHIAYSYDVGTNTLTPYIDGVEDTGATVTNVGSPTGFTTNDPFQVGVLRTGFDFFPGDIADARLWNTTRSATDIADNFDQRLSGSEPGLEIYYKLDEGSGLVAIDSVSTANDGTVTGATFEDVSPLPLGDNLARAMEFDGTDDHVLTGLTGMPASFTMEGWVEIKKITRSQSGPPSVTRPISSPVTNTTRSDPGISFSTETFRAKTFRKRRT